MVYGFLFVVFCWAFSDCALLNVLEDWYPLLINFRQLKNFFVTVYSVAIAPLPSKEGYRLCELLKALPNYHTQKKPPLEGREASSFTSYFQVCSIMHYWAYAKLSS